MCRVEERVLGVSTGRLRDCREQVFCLGFRVLGKHFVLHFHCCDGLSLEPWPKAPAQGSKAIAGFLPFFCRFRGAEHHKVLNSIP